MHWSAFYGRWTMDKNFPIGFPTHEYVESLDLGLVPTSILMKRPPWSRGKRSFARLLHSVSAVDTEISVADLESALMNRHLALGFWISPGPSLSRLYPFFPESEETAIQCCRNLVACWYRTKIPPSPIKKSRASATWDGGPFPCRCRFIFTSGAYGLFP
jgi:hypothetical protein